MLAKKRDTAAGPSYSNGIGGIETLEEQNKILNDRGVGRVSPFTVPRLMVNAASGNVSIILRITGPNTAVATASLGTNHNEQLTLTPVASGTSTITVTATDRFGLSKTVTFTVTVS